MKRNIILLKLSKIISGQFEVNARAFLPRCLESKFYRNLSLLVIANPKFTNSLLVGLPEIERLCILVSFLPENCDSIGKFCEDIQFNWEIY